MQPSPFKTGVNYGAMNALCCFAVFLLLYWMGFNPLGPAGVLAIWVPPLFIFFGTKKFRDSELGGFISYGMAFKTGYLVAFSGAMLYALIIYIFCTVVDPELVENFKNQILLEMEKTEGFQRSLLGDSLYEMSLEEIKTKTLKTVASGDFLQKCIGGAVICLITSAVLKRKPDNTI